MKKLNDKFYVYLHIKETTGEPFYVGKGCGNRKDSRSCRNRWWKTITNKYGFDTILLEENISEQDALKLELYWINRIGRRDLKLGTLVNNTNGGEGISGYSHTEEAKEKIRKSGIGRKHMLGKKFSEEHKRNISLGNIGKHTGKFKTLESRKKISDSLKGKYTEGTIVLDIETGVYYISISDAARHNNIKRVTLHLQLKGVNKNKTNLRIV